MSINFLFYDHWKRVSSKCNAYIYRISLVVYDTLQILFLLLFSLYAQSSPTAIAKMVHCGAA